METTQEYNDRKSIFIAKALSNTMGADPEVIRKEAEEMFDERNKDA